MEFFHQLKGLSRKEVDLEMIKYGKNSFHIPIPTFSELFKEHMLAPFFIFQLFCVALWFLDDMWYYSLFTLFMLMIFEATVVFQRLKNLQEFRSMSIAPYPIYVYRNAEWIQIQTEDLLPGDICSIIRQNDDNPIAADLLLLSGSCITNEAMLSGESTPQLKDSINLRKSGEIFNIFDDKSHVLFGGTRILQVTPAVGLENKSHQTQSARIPLLQAPNNGCVAVVIRTGFATQQGKLVRTIIYSNERITANNAEVYAHLTAQALFFILFLLIFAIGASYYVWTVGSKESDRDRSKLLLHCIMIITSVVPPELPMELSLAVNNALLSLSQVFVFCTEPFRIPLAGRIDVACFDKTGTLTAENLVVEGVTGLDDQFDTLFPATSLPKQTTLVLAGAHSLVMLEDGVIGDPMEKNTLESIQWKLKKNETIEPELSRTKLSVKILRRFPFSSTLKRMSCVITVHEGLGTTTLVTAKGAPETIRAMLRKVPEKYDENFKYWARKGKRVLALAYKDFKTLKLGEVKNSSVHDVHRDEIEKDLIFAGFLIFYCPLKADSKESIHMLNNSSHRVII